jgi:CRISPR-associated endonuclease Csn1
MAELLMNISELKTISGILDESVKGGFKKDLDEGEKKLKTLYNSLDLQ